MGTVLAGMIMSLDGFVNDRNGDSSRLYPNFHELRETDYLQESMKTTGAVVMGRRSYDMGNGDYTGYEYQVPIFVLTHHKPEQVAKGENDKLSFTFLEGDVKNAIEQAKAAAGDKDVVIVGGADVIQQCIKAGVLDELHIGIVPVLLGDGLRLFEHLGTEPPSLEKYRLVELPGGHTEILFRVIK